MLALAVPFAIFVYHGGALEPARHAVIPSTILRLGALMLILLAVDRLLDRRPARIRAGVPGELRRSAEKDPDPAPA
jgi:hypothetical protein